MYIYWARFIGVWNVYATAHALTGTGTSGTERRWRHDWVTEGYIAGCAQWVHVVYSIVRSLLVFLLPRARVLEPDLRDPLAEAGDLGYPLEVLAIGIAVQLEISLKYLELFFCEGRPHSLCLLLLTRPLVWKMGREWSADGTACMVATMPMGTQVCLVVWRGNSLNYRIC